MNAAAMAGFEAELTANIDRWREDPVACVREVFGAEPDEWQVDVLRALPRNKKLAMSACKGPGKSCVLAWIVWWFMLCFAGAQVVAVSITADNLKDNLWKELGVWFAKSELLQKSFDFGGERIKSLDAKHERFWWVSARAFAKDADPSQQANTLAGLHANNVMIVLDEVGDYPLGVVPAAEAIFANKVNAKLVVAGNPTSVQGPLYQIVTKDAPGWHITFITGDPDDAKRSPRIDIDWARAEIAKHGRDNPWVMVNILGKFPPAASNQLISINLVMDAQNRDVGAESYLSDPIIWGLDPSRFGDDEAALARRQGVLTRRFVTWRNLDGTQLAAQVGFLLREAKDEGAFPDALFVDVGGVGASAFDQLRRLGWEELVHGVDFGGSADDPKRFANKRVEMWWRGLEHLKGMPACLPADPILQSELTGPTYDFRVVQKQTVFILESKGDMKKRGVPSPNRADAWVLTFAKDVNPRGHSARAMESAGRRHVAVTDYDPLARAG